MNHGRYILRNVPDFLPFSCNDEMWLTWLDIVEWQARNPSHPSGVDMWSQIADAIEWTIALWVITTTTAKWPYD